MKLVFVCLVGILVVFLPKTVLSSKILPGGCASKLIEGKSQTIETPGIANKISRVVPSPDGRYFAIFSGTDRSFDVLENKVRIYDSAKKQIVYGDAENPLAEKNFDFSDACFIGNHFYFAGQRGTPGNFNLVIEEVDLTNGTRSIHTQIKKPPELIYGVFVVVEIENEKRIFNFSTPGQKHPKTFTILEPNKAPQQPLTIPEPKFGWKFHVTDAAVPSLDHTTLQYIVVNYLPAEVEEGSPPAHPEYERFYGSVDISTWQTRQVKLTGAPNKMFELSNGNVLVNKLHYGWLARNVPAIEPEVGDATEGVRRPRPPVQRQPGDYDAAEGAKIPIRKLLDAIQSGIEITDEESLLGALMNKTPVGQTMAFNASLNRLAAQDAGLEWFSLSYDVVSPEQTVIEQGINLPYLDGFTQSSSDWEYPLVNVSIENAVFAPSIDRPIFYVRLADHKQNSTFALVMAAEKDSPMKHYLILIGEQIHAIGTTNEGSLLLFENSKIHTLDPKVLLDHARSAFKATKKSNEKKDE